MVFLGPPLKLVDVGFPAGTIRLLDPKADGILLDVPTAQIWSQSGVISRGMDQTLLQLSTEEVKEDLVHGLGHDVPGASSDEALGSAVLVIERTIERARVFGK